MVQNPPPNRKPAPPRAVAGGGPVRYHPRRTSPGWGAPVDDRLVSRGGADPHGAAPAARRWTDLRVWAMVRALRGDLRAILIWWAVGIFLPAAIVFFGPMATEVLRSGSLAPVAATAVAVLSLAGIVRRTADARRSGPSQALPLLRKAVVLAPVVFVMTGLTVMGLVFAPARPRAMDDDVAAALAAAVGLLNVCCILAASGAFSRAVRTRRTYWRLPTFGRLGMGVACLVLMIVTSMFRPAMSRARQEARMG